MKKNISVLVVIMVMLLSMFSGCSGQKLSADFNETKVREAARTAVMYLNEKQYDAFSMLVKDDLKASLNEEVLKNAISQVMPNAGTFTEITNFTIIGQKDKSGNNCAVVQVMASYEKQMLVYTITFDVGLKIIGFYLK